MIEEGLRGGLVANNVLSALPELDPEYLSAEDIDRIEAGYDTLVVKNNKGRFLKLCPGTKHYLCCLYYFLNIGLNCPFDCTYCILHVYLNNDTLIVHANYEDMLSELKGELADNPSLVRIGTGELTDSLALDPIVGLSPVLIDFFSNQDQAYIELKTKSDNVDHLINLDHKGRTIISWSLNPQCVIDREDGSAACLQSRLMAAKRCQESGYKIGIHFDPILFFDGWEQEYERVIDELFSVLDSKTIVWISMGCFRFIPPLKGIIKERFPESRIIYEEFIPGIDKKMRYPQVLRINIYSKMASMLRRHAKDVFIYLCMESKDVWREGLGCVPDNNRMLKGWLDKRCFI